MALDKEMKKKVIEDWKYTFPQLTLYAQNKLYKIVGPCIVGIELIKSPYTKGYSPYFVMYPNWKKNVKECLDFPVFLLDFKNDKGFQYEIPYEKHDMLFRDIVESVKKQIPLPFDGNITFKRIVTTIDGISKTPPLSAAPNSYLQAALQEAKLKIALFICVKEAQSILEQICKRSWDSNHFNACGVDVCLWLQSLQEVINSRGEFLKQIEMNKKDVKFKKLLQSELV